MPLVRGGTTPMEVLPVTTAAGKPPQPRRIPIMRFDAMGACVERVGRRLGSLEPWRRLSLCLIGRFHGLAVIS